MKDLVPWGDRAWAPFKELRREMNRLFDSVLHDTSAATTSTTAWSPLVDIKENQEGYEVNAELPGMARDDISINVTGNTLTLSGERKRESEEKGDNYHRVERYFGKFPRSFTFPEEIEPAKISAVYKDGVLTIRVPKSEQAKPKQIEIRVE